MINPDLDSAILALSRATMSVGEEDNTNLTAALIDEGHKLLDELEQQIRIISQRGCNALRKVD